MQLLSLDMLFNLLDKKPFIDGVNRLAAPKPSSQKGLGALARGQVA